MRWCVILIAGVASLGCRQILGIDDLPDAAPCAGTSFGVSPFDACVTLPATATPLEGAIDTDTSTLCLATTLQDGTPACVVGGDSVTVGSVTATGSRPLVIVAATTITVTTLLDVASHGTRDQARVGAGGDATSCGAPVDSTFTVAGGGGGYGGSFGTKGGDGAPGGDAGMGGTSASITPVTSLRGGCAGGTGGSMSPIAVGHGGGAVFLIATTSIRLSGPINASGSGGDGATIRAGGGGGGSGGLIGLDAPMIVIDDGIAVIANGGGGGEGGSSQAGGQSGREPDPTTPMTSAPGGSATASGGNGGSGATGSTAATPGAAGDPGMNGGGGGGGGVGVVIVRGTVTGTGVFSPAP